MSTERRIDWHDLQATQFDAVEPELFEKQIKHHEAMAAELRAGRDACAPTCGCRAPAAAPEGEPT